MKTPKQFATQLAQAAGEILLTYYQPGGLAANLKSDRTVVTAADYAADEFIRAEIHTNFPEDGLLSEEENTIFPQKNEYVWIIDPLDGTTNFSLGLHHWGVAIARLKNGYPELGVLYFPSLNELFVAERGKGAFLNERQLRVNPNMDQLPATFFSCCSRAARRYQLEIPYKMRILGSAAYGLATVARGSAIVAFEVTPKVWDFSASWLITREAGGVIALLDGSSPFPLTSGENYEKKSHALLVAPTQALWDSARQKISKRG